jgi:hypothetical protein
MKRGKRKYSNAFYQGWTVIKRIRIYGQTGRGRTKIMTVQIGNPR